MQIKEIPLTHGKKLEKKKVVVLTQVPLKKIQKLRNTENTKCKKYKIAEYLINLLI